MKTRDIKIIKKILQLSFIFLFTSCSINIMAATHFSAERQPLGSIAPIVLSDTDLSHNNVSAYRAWFENGSWQGDLIQYSVDHAGQLSTSVNLLGTSPTNLGDSPANWSAFVKMAAAETADADYWNTGRKIITNVSNSQKAFRWHESTGIGSTNMALLDQTASDASAISSDILNYIRGERSKEFPAVTALRARNSILGDIIHSNPVYVEGAGGNRNINGYATWAATQASRDARVYVGSNDGMLHVFDADTGSEVYAYIPSMLMGKLKNLAARPYIHSYFVDGKLTARDVYFGDAWHTVLVGSLGAGGRGFFALDITNPDLSAETATSGTDNKVLWEVDASSDNDLGDSFSRSVIAKLNDDKWYAVTGNGYNSTNGQAILYITDIETGIVKRISTEDGSSDNPNGLSSPALLDNDGDGKVDYAYAGDIDGNLWKFDLTGAAGDWDVVSDPLHPYQTKGVRPITIKPLIAKHPIGGYMIYFATGRLYNSADSSNTAVQAMYGIWDKPGATPPSKDTQSLHTQTWHDVIYNCCGDNEKVAVYNPDAGDVTWLNEDSSIKNHGWMVEFPSSYRVLEDIQIRGSRAKVVIHKPETNENYAVEAALADGGPHSNIIYDLNGDGGLVPVAYADPDNGLYTDLVDGNNDGNLLDTTSEDVPMAWKMPNGLMSQFTIARVSNGVDTMFLNFLIPPVNEPCVVDCNEGFQRGHVDVDTWKDSNTFGGGSTKHEHEYDKKVGRVYMDFFDLNVQASDPPETADIKDVSGHVNINSADSGIDGDEKFVILIANADFSPGSTFTVGDKSWNVVDYQRQLHIALKNWDASDSTKQPLDSDGDSLIFTWKGIAVSKGGTGNIRHAFDDMAILAGGLHPTETGCVKDNAYQTYNKDTQVGRWRNGALVTQLVKASYFSASSAIANVVIQRPTDLVETVHLTNNSDIQLTQDFNNNGVIEENNHERMGGLIAKSGTEHIWESTLFWHYKGTCYGNDGWEEDVAIATAPPPPPTEEQLAALLELEKLGLGISDLDAEIKKYDQCAKDAKKAKDKKKEDECKEMKELLKKLKDKLKDYEPPFIIENDSETGNGEIPVIMGGGTEYLGVTAGPKFSYGRAGWTDIVPEINVE